VSSPHHRQGLTRCTQPDRGRESFWVCTPGVGDEADARRGKAAKAQISGGECEPPINRRPAAGALGRNPVARLTSTPGRASLASRTRRNGASLTDRVKRDSAEKKDLTLESTAGRKRAILREGGACVTLQLAMYTTPPPVICPPTARTGRTPSVPNRFRVSLPGCGPRTRGGVVTRRLVRAVGAHGCDSVLWGPDVVELCSLCDTARAGLPNQGGSRRSARVRGPGYEVLLLEAGDADGT
jgi:hypothetical protein